MGFETKEIAISSGFMDISLEAVSGKLDDVVVVEYGVQRVTKVSEAISSVKGADIQHQKPMRTEDASQGRASGVSVLSNGSPGVKPTVLIRSIPSYTDTDIRSRMLRTMVSDWRSSIISRSFLDFRWRA